MNKSEVIHLRIESETMEAIRKHSKEQYRSINQSINFLLRMSILILKQNTPQGGGNK